MRETPRSIGARRARMIRARLASELGIARRRHGLGIRTIARTLGVSHQRLSDVERDEGPMSLEVLAAFAAAVGLELAVSVHPAGPPVRDKAHLALIERFRARLAPELHLRLEVPMPIAGDRRSADGVLHGPGWDALLEAETRLDDVQALIREIEAKRRDLGVLRAILLVSDTRHDRRVITAVPELTLRFPVGTRAALAAFKVGRDPGGDCLIVL